MRPSAGLAATGRTKPGQRLGDRWVAWRRSTQLIVPVDDAPAARCQAASATVPGRGKQTDRVSMSASTLFPESMTPSTGPLANLEPHVVWLQRSLQPEAAARRRVNAWYQNFRDPDGQLAPRLTSTDNEAYYVALDELYVHQALRRLEPDVRYEEGGQGPDLRVYRDGHQVSRLTGLGPTATR